MVPGTQMVTGWIVHALVIDQFGVAVEPKELDTYRKQGMDE